MMRIGAGLSVISILLSSALASGECIPQREDAPDSIFVVETVCDGREISKKKYFFRSSGTVGRQEEFSHGRLVRVRIWSIDGEAGSIFENRFETDSVWIEEVFDRDGGNLLRRSRRMGSPEYNQPQTVLQDWRIVDGVAKEINHLVPGTDVVFLRQILGDREQVNSQVRFQYAENLGKYETPYLTKIEFQDAQGQSLGVFKKGFQPQELLIKQAPVSEAQRREWLAEHRRPKEPVLIIDSGFDVRHFDLISKLWSNPLESIDGVDNDNNGWVDDVHGWNIKAKNNDISDLLYRPSHGEPFSHGTHVASVALASLKKFGLLGYAGNMASPLLLSKSVDSIRRHRIRFANMSFGWDAEDSNGASPFTPGSDATAALEDLISRSPETLFVVAASNDGKELNGRDFCSYPACFRYKNMLKVGALDISEARENLLVKAKVSDFSNYGVDYVDLFAPGEQVLGAALGNRHIRLDGTSMASPYVLNVILKMSEIMPELSPLVLREILLKSVFVPAKPLPAKSGGMLFPKRALLAVEILKARGAVSVDEAVMKARAQTPMAGELRAAGTLRVLWERLRSH